MERPRSQPIAFCWHHGREMGKRDIEFWECNHQSKQTYGICEHLMYYGDIKEAIDPMEMQRIYDNLINDLTKLGVRIEGRGLSLVQAMPGGVKIVLTFDDAEKARREKLRKQNRKCV